MSEQKHVAIIDHVGRNIVGKLVKEDETTITLNNPVILHVQPGQNGQLEVQSFPIFFFEFIKKDARDKNDWTYHKESVVLGHVELDDRILSQYEKINTPPEAQTDQKKPNIVSIDDLQ